MLTIYNHAVLKAFENYLQVVNIRNIVLPREQPWLSEHAQRETLQSASILQESFLCGRAGKHTSFTCDNKHLPLGHALMSRSFTRWDMWFWLIIFLSYKMPGTTASGHHDSMLYKVLLYDHAMSRFTLCSLAIGGEPWTGNQYITNM